MNKFTKMVYGLWIAFTTALFFFFFFVISIHTNLFGWWGDIPDFEELENPKSEMASTVYSSDGKVLGHYFSKNRDKVPFEKISQNVIKALIATEDLRYEEHSGIDFRATIRMITGVLTLNPDGGGSTLSQQLAKNLFNMRKEKRYRGSLYDFSPTKALGIKAKEWITAIRLERAYTKEEIITMYLNTVDFNYSSLGIQAASKTYFNKPATDLNIQEASLLVGMLKGPSLYNPRRKVENATNRRNVVFYQMKVAQFITKKEQDSLAKIPIQLDFNLPSQSKGKATYFRGVLENDVKKILTNIEKKTGKKYNLYKDGLKIYTTVDANLQKYAEQSVLEHMKFLQEKFRKDWRKKTPWSAKEIERAVKSLPLYHQLVKKYGSTGDSLKLVLNQKELRQVFTYDGVVDTMISPIDKIIHDKWFLRTGFLSVEPQTGHVKAWVGGVNKEHFAYDHVRQGSRQVGSTFKPLLYSTSLNIKNYNPCTQILDGPVTLRLPDGKVWEPRGKPSGDMITLKTALARSLNPIAAKLIHEVGVGEVVKHAAQFGIKIPKHDQVPSLALGVTSISLYDLIGVYTTFVNEGVFKKPVYLVRIEDKHGRLIQVESTASKIIMSKENAFKMVQMLKGSTQIRGGTAVSLGSKYHLTDGINEMGGKTGTTQKSADGWFFGITEQLVSGCWVGGETNKIAFRSGYYGQGARMALPIFGKYMQKAYKDIKTGIKKQPFKVPERFTQQQIAEEILCTQLDESFTRDSTSLPHQEGVILDSGSSDEEF